MTNEKRGLRIGHYRITPLGIGVICALLVVVVAAVVLSVTVFDTPPDRQSESMVKATASPTANVEASATPEPTATIRPTSTPKPEPRSATIRMLGEITLDNDLLKSVYNATDQTFDFSPMFSEISDVVGGADYTIAQVEGSLGGLQGISGTDAKRLTPPAILTALKDAGVDMVTLANDHALDGGFADLQAAMKNATDAGLAYIGTASTAEEKSAPVVKDINGIKVGFTAYCESLNVKKKDLEENALAYGINLTTNSDAHADIQALRDAGAEVVIALVDWGKQGSATPSKEQGQIAQVLATSGADVIMGYGPRILQPIIPLNSDTQNTLCLCAPGNFLCASREQNQDCGVIFEITLREQEDGSIAVETPKYIPTYVLRVQDENNLYQYRALAVGQWTDDAAGNLPEGMAYADLQYMATIWTNVQKFLGEEVASIARE